MNQYEDVVKEFQEADQKYWELCNKFLDGSIIKDLFDPSAGTPDRMIRDYQGAVTELERRREDRNVKLTTAANAMRQATTIKEGEWRGPEGKSTVIKAGPFICSSVTRRGFDVDSLFEFAKKKGVFERLLQLKGYNADGVEFNLVQQEWDVDYDGVKKWLQQNNLDDILKGAYDEKESTPQCKGPKQVAAMGEELK